MDVDVARGHLGTPLSDGIASVRDTTPNVGGRNSSLMGEVAEDVTFDIFHSCEQAVYGANAIGREATNQALQKEAQCGQMAALEEELIKYKAQVEELVRYKAQVESSVQELSRLRREKVTADDQLNRSMAERRTVQEQLADAKFELEQLRLATSQKATLSMHLDLKEDSSQNVSTVLPSEDGQDPDLLATAYQQISVLNTQLAHLYTELTMARTEAQQWRGQLKEQEQSRQYFVGDGDSGIGAADTQKQNEQIADLVSDIRHLQLDLEYHQQKLDQMLDEKQHMVKELQSSRDELAETRKTLNERDQALKHREVDLLHLRQLLGRSDASKDTAQGDVQGSESLSALRAEVAAKDSALIVSHYELHKEKLMRERLEQKNLKLMERMQKLMLVVESMRKDNSALERSLAVKDRSADEKDLQLRQLAHGQKVATPRKHPKVPRSQISQQRGGHGDGILPPVDRALRSDGFGSAAASQRSWMSTPKTPRVG